MADVTEQRVLRRAQAHAAARASILEAARRVAKRSGARELSLRGVAAEAGFAPAALYGYFSGKDELLLALAADDLAVLTRAMRAATANTSRGQGKLASAATAALGLLCDLESLAAAPAVLPSKAAASDAERLFNGRLIAALKVLSEAADNPADNREAQCDAVLVGSAVAGLALLARSGRLRALGFAPEEILQRLENRFAASPREPSV